MKKIIILTLALFSIQLIVAQDTTVYDIKDVDLNPGYSDGMDAFYKFIQQNFKSPEEEGISGKIISTFIVEIDGSISDIKIIQDVGFGSGNEIIRVLKKAGKWNAAQKNGKSVRSLFEFPVSVQSTD